MNKCFGIANKLVTQRKIHLHRKIEKKKEKIEKIKIKEEKKEKGR